MKQKILITALFFLFALASQAQDKYQFMVIEYRSWTTTLFVTIDGETFTKENVDGLKKEDDKLFNVNPLIKRAKEYQEKGWEIMNFTNVPGQFYTAFLRKKIETK